MTDRVEDLLGNLSDLVTELTEHERADSFESDHNSVMRLESSQRGLAEFFFNNPAFLRTIRAIKAEREALVETISAIEKIAAAAHRHRGNIGKEAFFLAVIEQRAQEALKEQSHD